MDTASDISDRLRDGLQPPAPDRVVLAAGGIVLVEGDAGLEVLVVHRPAYDDWTLPKGHVDAGESLEAAALREVLEETGLAARIVVSAGTTVHQVELPDGTAAKQVHWFLMVPAGTSTPGAHAGDDEVDRICWWPVTRAVQDLTHSGEQELLRDTATIPIHEEPT